MNEPTLIPVYVTYSGDLYYLVVDNPGGYFVHGTRVPVNSGMTPQPIDEEDIPLEAMELFRDEVRKAFHYHKYAKRNLQ